MNEQQLLALLQEAGQVIELLSAEVQEARNRNSGTKTEGQQKTASDLRDLSDAFGVPLAKLPEGIKTASISAEDGRRLRSAILGSSASLYGLGKTASVENDEPCYTTPGDRLNAQMSQLING